MTAEIGLVTMLLAFVAALYAIAASVYGVNIRSDRMIASGRNAALATFPLLIASIGALLIALVNQEYQIYYVWSVSDPQTTLFYRITALWGSQRGSLLFWSLLMSAFSTGAILINWRNVRRLMPYAIAFMMATLAFFLALSIIWENPFERWWILPDNEVVSAAFIPANATAPSASRLAETANGLNPMLRHFGMIIHPPMLYLGFVGFVIPYAFGMAALASGDLSTNWLKVTRRWTLVSWLFLSLGLILGGRWAYDVLGWGGYWGWDPVENAAFLPWLVGTAFLHSVIMQEKRGMFKMWNMFLVIGAFSTVIFGTFATRSGLVDSVHSFAQSEIGFPMFFFWAAMTIISVALILLRRSQGKLSDDQPLTHFFSREVMFLLNNVVFMILTFIIFWGSFGAPITSEVFLGKTITYGPESFEAVTPFFFLAMYVLMGVAPLFGWGATSFNRLGRALLIPVLMSVAVIVFALITGIPPVTAIAGYGIVSLGGFVALYETYRGVAARSKTQKENVLTAVFKLFARNRRRYGGYVIHLGVTIIGIGIIGSTLFQDETQQTLKMGESLVIQDYEVRYDNFTDALADDGRWMKIADVTLLRNGQEIAHLRPRQDIYPTMPMTIPGQHSTLENDVYVLLVEWREISSGNITLKVYINPLINLVWYGGIILILGTFVAAWPYEPVPARVRDRKRTARRAHAPVG